MASSPSLRGRSAWLARGLGLPPRSALWAVLPRSPPSIVIAALLRSACAPRAAAPPPPPAPKKRGRVKRGPKSEQSPSTAPTDRQQPRRGGTSVDGAKKVHGPPCLLDLGDTPSPPEQGGAKASPPVRGATGGLKCLYGGGCWRIRPSISYHGRPRLSRSIVRASV